MHNKKEKLCDYVDDNGFSALQIAQLRVPKLNFTIYLKYIKVQLYSGHQSFRSDCHKIIMISLYIFTGNKNILFYVLGLFQTSSIWLLSTTPSSLRP